jgi:hypothetical protein
LTVRDLLLVLQIAICAVLVTSSMVAVRGLARSLHANFGFDPQDTLLVETNLAMSGYPPDKMAAMQRQMMRDARDFGRELRRAGGHPAPAYGLEHLICVQRPRYGPADAKRPRAGN